MKLFRKLNNQFSYSQIAIFIIIPLISMIVGLILTTYNFYTSYTNIVKENCYSRLKSFSSDCEDSLSQIVSLSSTVIKNNNVLQTLQNKGDIYNPEVISNIKKEFDFFCNNASNVESVLIISPKGDFVVSDSGVASLESFFSGYTYFNYSVAYWQKFNFLVSYSYRILSPSVVKNGKETKNIIPIVIKQIGNNRFNNILVVNVNLDKLLDKSFSYKYTQNSHTYMLNKYTGEIFTSNTEKSGINILKTSLYSSLVSGEITFDYINEKQEKNFVICYSSSDSLLGYTYYAIVPYYDISKIQTPFMLTSLIILLFSLIATIVSTIYSTNKIIAPFAKVADFFGAANKSKKGKNVDIIKYIENEAKSVISQNYDLSMSLPYAQEKYLINYLNETEYLIDDYTKEMLICTLPFKYNYFASIIVHLYPTNLLLKTYDNAGYSNIQSGFYNIVKEMFNDSFDAFFVSSEKETLYIILNMENDSESAKIDDILVELKSYLKNDMEFIELYIGRGEIGYNLEGMKQSHEQALNNLKIIPQEKEEIIFKLPKKNESFINYIFTDSDESKLFNSLISNNTGDALNIIKNVAQQNIRIDIRSQKQMYHQILSVILRVMKIKNIQYDTENKGDIAFLSLILDLQIKDIHLTILKLVNEISSNKKYRIERDDIVSYINSNYSDVAICLNSIANEFGTTPNYISKMIKDALGIGFQEYLTNLRVSKAKELLTETAKISAEIYVEVGFGSKQTFFRCFKSIIGLTPNEYRTKFKTEAAEKVLDIVIKI